MIGRRTDILCFPCAVAEKFFLQNTEKSPFPPSLPDTSTGSVPGKYRKYFVQRLSSKVYRPFGGQKKQDRLRVNFSLQLIENVVLTDYRHFTCRRCTKIAIFCTKSAISFEKFVVFLHFQIYVLWRNRFRL